MQFSGDRETNKKPLKLSRSTGAKKRRKEPRVSLRTLLDAIRTSV